MVSKEKKSDYKVIGTRPIRHDGYDKVTGRAQYGADIKLPGMIYGAVLRSPHAHAKIKNIDTSKAENTNGVFAVMTAKDLPRLTDKQRGNSEESGSEKHLSENVMASDKVLYKGHVVAAVSANDVNTAREAAKKIIVEYEILKPVINVDQAMDKDAPILHEDFVGDHLGKKVKNTNIATYNRYKIGDAEEAFKMVEENNCNLIDIREAGELEKTGSVENSVHISRGMMEIFLDPNSAYFQQGKLDQNKEMVLFCAGGVRSALAVKALQNMGYERVSHIEGGFSAISQSKFKIV